MCRESAVGSMPTYAVVSSLWRVALRCRASCRVSCRANGALLRNFSSSSVCFIYLSIWLGAWRRSRAAAHGAELVVVAGALDHLAVIAAGFFGVERQVELVAPSEVVTGPAHGVVAQYCRRMSLAMSAAWAANLNVTTPRERRRGRAAKRCSLVVT